MKPEDVARYAGEQWEPSRVRQLRRKLLPTLWVSESLTRRRLARAGLSIVAWQRPNDPDFMVVARKS